MNHIFHSFWTSHATNHKNYLVKDASKTFYKPIHFQLIYLLSTQPHQNYWTLQSFLRHYKSKAHLVTKMLKCSENIFIRCILDCSIYICTYLFVLLESVSKKWYSCHWMVSMVLLNFEKSSNIFFKNWAEMKFKFFTFLDSLWDISI